MNDLVPPKKKLHIEIENWVLSKDGVGLSHGKHWMQDIWEHTLFIRRQVVSFGSTCIIAHNREAVSNELRRCTASYHIHLRATSLVYQSRQDSQLISISERRSHESYPCCRCWLFDPSSRCSENCRMRLDILRLKNDIVTDRETLMHLDITVASRDVLRNCNLSRLLCPYTKPVTQQLCTEYIETPHGVPCTVVIPAKACMK